MTDKELLFVGGCARSGTTVLTRMLNAHPDVLLGNERFYRVFERGELTRAHFARRRFLTFEPGDTHDEPPGLAMGDRPHFLGEAADERYDAARMVGDKYPPIFRVYDMVAERFQDTHIVYILRNPVSVAESYQARADDVSDRWPFDFARAVRDWNESVASTLAALGRGLRVTVVTYEAVIRSADAVRGVLGRLGLSPQLARPFDDILAHGAALAGRPLPRDETIRQHVCRNADFESYRALITEHAIA